jgi:hypothetical protein
MNSGVQTPEEEVTYFEDFFVDFDAPCIEEISFDAALDRAAASELDIAASVAITKHFERAKAHGDLIRLQEMAMVLGAAACMHDHLQQLSGDLTSTFFDPNNTHSDFGSPHQHDEEGCGDDEDDEGSPTWFFGKRLKRKKRKLLNYRCDNNAKY